MLTSHKLITVHFQLKAGRIKVVRRVKRRELVKTVGAGMLDCDGDPSTVQHWRSVQRDPGGGSAAEPHTYPHEPLDSESGSDSAPPPDRRWNGSQSQGED